MLDFPLNKLQILSLTAFIFSDLNYKIVIFLSQTERNPKHFFRKKALTKTKSVHGHRSNQLTLKGSVSKCHNFSPESLLNAFNISFILNWVQSCTNLNPNHHTE
jgi:hypothetical protein